MQVFRAVYISSDMGMRKPSENIFKHVLDLWKVSSSQAVFFDDFEENVVGARQIGIDAVLVKSDKTVPKWIEENITIN